LLVVQLTAQRISACNCIPGLGDFLVENRDYNSWTVKSEDFSGKQSRPICA